MSDWIKNNKALASQFVAFIIFSFGIVLIIGAVKDWNWLYQPDGHFQNNWNMGQISRYLGRTTARVIGFVGGVALTGIGAFWSYQIFVKQ